MRHVEVIEPDGRHLAPAEMPAGEQATMTRHNVQFGVDEHRHVKAEALDAARDLLDLRTAMQTRVVGIELEMLDGLVGDREPW